MDAANAIAINPASVVAVGVVKRGVEERRGRRLVHAGGVPATVPATDRGGGGEGLEAVLVLRVRVHVCVRGRLVLRRVQQEGVAGRRVRGGGQQL